MSKRKVGKYHMLLDKDLIRNAWSGDEDALCKIIAAYMDYVRAVIIVSASHYGIEGSEIPVDDILQNVWIKFLTERMHIFKL